ncbi:MAG: DUF504 domain-containing protein [Candidatus Nanoarchaeia archaeon]
MITAKEYLSKIKWDPKENPDEHSLLYYDRITKSLEELGLRELKIEENIIKFVNMQGETINIPLHRIRVIKKNGEIVWKR